MKIFLDSTELTQYNLLNTKNSSIQKMFDMSEQNLINVYISQIVLDEVEKNNIVKINEILNKISKNINEISKYDIGNYIGNIKTNPDIEDCFKSRVDELKNVCNIEIVEYPTDSNIVELLIGRYKNRLAPFHNKTDSWKDYLIWLSYKKIIETIDDEDIVFISANTSDFSKNKGESLHPDLTIEDKNIQYYKTYKDFSDKNTKYKV